MQKSIMQIAVSSKCPDIEAKPELIAKLRAGDTVMFKGIKCIVHEYATGDTIYFTTEDSSPDQYNQAVEDYLDGDGFGFSEGVHPNYKHYVRHIRLPDTDKNKEEGQSLKRNRWGIGFHTLTRAVATRAEFAAVIKSCTIT